MGWAIEPGLIRHQPLSYDKTFDSIHILLSIIQKVKQIPITVIRISLPRIKVFFHVGPKENNQSKLKQNSISECLRRYSKRRLVSHMI